MRYSDNPFKHAHTPRTDITGRHSPLHVPREIPQPFWLAVLGGVVMGVILALMVWWAI